MIDTIIYKLDNIDIFENRLKKDGKDYYLRKIMEESAEFSAAISHYADNKISKDELLDEIADILLQINKALYFISENGMKDIICDTRIIEEKLLQKIQGLIDIDKK